VANVQLKFKIHEILTEGTWRPVVVCENGAIDFLHKIKESYNTRTPIEGDIVKCSIACVQNTLCVVCLARQEVNYILSYYY